MKDAVVKIDREILNKAEEFLERNKYKYSSKKQVVNLAILEFLKINSLNINKKKRIKKKKS